MTTVYLTFDGLLEPIGTSQVVRPLIALAEGGHPYAVVSLEKPRDLANASRLTALSERLRAAGIDWRYAPFCAGGGAAKVARNVARLTRLGLTLTLRRRAHLLHPRAHLSASVALAIHRVTRTPYLFDFRGYWVDEQQAQGRWFVPGAPYRLGKLWERRLISNAAAMVTLTNLARDDIRTGLLTSRHPPSERVVTIPTVADFQEFRPGDETPAVGPEIASRLRNRLVVAFIGAFNPFYAVDESLHLFQEIARRRPDAHLLCMTRQTETAQASLNACGIAPSQRTLVSVPHREICDWLRLVDWGLLLIHPTYSKRGSMPTKLAELLASGVRPLQFGCNDEVGDWVRRTGAGIALDSLDREALAKAADRVAADPLDPKTARRAREIASAHFSLQSGIDRYAQLLGTLAARPWSAKLRSS